MKKIIIISLIISAIQMNVMAQSASDAVLFSRHLAGGTARSTGMSGAFGALGGDLSTLSVNPAGLAVYRGSEFTFTPVFVFTNTSAKYGDITFRDRGSHFKINNIGYAYTKNLFNEKGLKTINFGVAYNRLSDFNSDTYIKRANASSSLLNEFVYYANRNEISPFYEDLALTTGALFFDEDEKRYMSDYDLFGYDKPVPMYRSMSTGGGLGEYAFSMGFNFNHKLFLGATLGIQDLSYKEYYFHEENPDFQYMSGFDFGDEYSVEGFGVNFKAGIIYRPLQALRLGAAIHTPTYFSMHPYHFTSMMTYWNSTPPTKDDYWEAESDFPEGYRMNTPWRYSLSAASVIGKFGLLDVDVELVDYTNCNISPKSTYDFENEDINSDLKSAVNVKAGAEIRLGPVFLRGGMAYYGNPYNKNSPSFDDPIVNKTLKGTMSYSGGIGFRHRDFYMDAAYSFIKQPEKINDLYISDWDAQSIWYEYAKLQTQTGKFILTFGFRF